MTVDDMGDLEVVQLVNGAIVLERLLMEPGVRTAGAAIDQLLDDDFTEIGASGRLWTRPEMIRLLLADDPLAGRINESEMNGNLLTPELVLLTYVSERDGRRARRSSLWRRSDGRWRLLFHQGTPLD